MRAQEAGAGEAAMAAAVGECERTVLRHAEGRLTARERLDILFDESSFAEIGPPGDGVIIAAGAIQGRPVFAFSQDAIDASGIVTQRHAEKVIALVDHAVQAGWPIIGLYDSPGISLGEGLASLEAQVVLMQRQALARAVVPQVALVFGQSWGASAFSPVLADIVFMLKGSMLGTAGPLVAREATGEIATAEALGGAVLHATITGVADGIYADELELLFAARDLIDLLPPFGGLPSERSIPDAQDREDPGLNLLVPLDPDASYDMRELVRALSDGRAPFEIQADHAGNMLCALAQIDGRAVGIVASQPLVLSGAIDGAAARKAARFVRFCGSFGLPIVTIVDSPGFAPGTAGAADGIVQHGADLLAAYAGADVPRITIVTRRALGGAWAVLAARPLGGSQCYAWPGAEIAPMRGTAAAQMLFAEAEHQKKRDYAERIADPGHAVAAGFVDAVIRPAATRRTIVRALRQTACDQSSGSTLPHPLHPERAIRERDRNG
jgi:propionyl-CoA carboxylase beta chain